MCNLYESITGASTAKNIRFFSHIALKYRNSSLLYCYRSSFLILSILQKSLKVEQFIYYSVKKLPSYKNTETVSLLSLIPTKHINIRMDRPGDPLLLFANYGITRENSAQLVTRSRRA